MRRPNKVAAQGSFPSWRLEQNEVGSFQTVTAGTSVLSLNFDQSAHGANQNGSSDGPRSCSLLNGKQALPTSRLQ